VTIAVVDAAGTVIRGARANVTFTVSGPGELLGLGNGDHMNHVPGQGTTHLATYDGLALAILRGAKPSTSVVAPLSLTVSADGLPSATVDINVVF
jgi:beta-galactosidase